MQLSVIQGGRSSLEDWVEIGPLEAIPSRGARVIRNPDGDIAVFRAGDDHVFALRDRCPHKGGPLSQGIVYGHRVACPLHNWNINLQDGIAVAPDQGCAASFPVRVENGRVYLNLIATQPEVPCGEAEHESV